MRIPVTVFCLIFTSFQALGDGPAWSVDALNGKPSYHAGADCFAAVVAAKGFEDQIANVTAMTMKYYLRNFCKVESGKTAPGDILAVTQTDATGAQYLVHAALALDGGKIFEKESADGIYSQSFHMSPFFLVKNFNESPFLNAATNHVTAYRCQDVSRVREKMKICKAEAEKIGIKAIRLEFQKMMMTASPDFYLRPTALRSMRSVANALEHASADDPCLEYLMVMSDSLVNAVAVLVGVGKDFADPSFARFPQHQDWQSAAADLNYAWSQAYASLSNYYHNKGLPTPAYLSTD